MKSSDQPEWHDDDLSRGDEGGMSRVELDGRRAKAPYSKMQRKSCQTG
jgi:hypothetical protein